eukprot:TRINITY_DN471_c0_g1_i1.p1 TRINITY_DN471_c0_g1~~TRINITY_DN471_c0_g1_i1.p1  ORF type:complete len:883 (-),score=283.22 TRINITY_DN471_c0_g1_i1:120-2768(-)
MYYKVGGIVLIVVGAIILIAGIVIGTFFSAAGETAFDGLLVYKRDSKFDVESYEKCTTSYFNAYMFNMTNPDAVLAGTERPNYAEVGPYRYSRQSCKFDVTNDEKYEYFHQYWTDYKLENSGKVSETDLITNFNPGYLAIMKQMEAINPKKPEDAFVQVVLSGVFKNLFAQLTSAKFLDQAKILGISNTMKDVQAQVLPKVVASVKAEFSKGFLLQQINTNATDSDLLFNEPTLPYGVGSIAVMNYSSSSQNAILYDTNFGFLISSRNMLNFASTMATGNTTLIINYLTVYQIDPQQAGVLAQWVQLRVLSTIYAFVAPLAQVNQVALNTFYSQWTNGTGIDPTGLDINGVGSHDDGFEVAGVGVASGLSYATVTKIWDANNTLAGITNMQGISSWFFMMTNSTTRPGWLAINGFTEQEFGTVAAWLQAWHASRVEPLMLAVYRLTSLDQLPWLQWGTGILPNGLSVSALDPANIPFAPEFGNFARSKGFNITFSADFSKNLMNGTMGFSGNYTNILTFSKLYLTNQTTLIQGAWNLPTEAIPVLFSYFQYMISTFVEQATLFNGVFKRNGGLIVKRTPHQILWSGQDPFASLLAPPARIGLFFNADQFNFTSRADTVNKNQTKLNNTIYFKKGSEADLQYFLDIHQYKGLTYVPGYKNATVEGNKNGENWLPASINRDSLLKMWYNDIAQTTLWEYVGEDKVQGIDIMTFGISPHMFETVDEYPDRANYSTFKQGLVNITGVKSVRTFISRPHMQNKVDPNVTSTFTGLKINGSDPYYNQFTLGIEHRSGITMKLVGRFQVTLGFTDLKRFWNVSEGYAPVMWQDNGQEIGEDDANKFKNGIKTIRVGTAVPLALGIPLGVIMIIVGVIFLFLWKKRVGTL